MRRPVVQWWDVQRDSHLVSRPAFSPGEMVQQLGEMKTWRVWGVDKRRGRMLVKRVYTAP